MAALFGVTFVLIYGIELSTFDARRLSDKEKAHLLDRYNSYSGSIASVVFVPFQQFVAILLPVFMLCFMTKTVLKESKSLLEQWGPVFGVVVVSWVLNQGLTAVNVQFNSPRVELVISANDLGTSTANSMFSLVMDNVTSTSDAAGNPSTDTLLHSAIHSTSRSFDSLCKEDSGIITEQPEASIRFGFPMNSWFEHMLPNSVAAEKSFSFSMSEKVSAETVDASVFPGADMNKTAVLFSYGLYAVSVQVRNTVDNVSSVAVVYDDIRSSDPATLISQMQTKIVNITVDPQISNRSTLWSNVSVLEIAIEFSNARLSDQILFEAVTFTLPITMETMRN